MLRAFLTKFPSFELGCVYFLIAFLSISSSAFAMTYFAPVPFPKQAADLPKGEKERSPPSPWSAHQWLARINGNYLYNSNFSDALFLQMTQPFWISRGDFPSNTGFFQFQAMTEGGVGTFIGGLGLRHLHRSKNWVFGLNGFYGATQDGDLQRASLGGDVFTPWVFVYGNLYFPIGGYKPIPRTSAEVWRKSISGGDIFVTAPMPNMPWLRLGISYFHDDRSPDQTSINGIRVFAQTHVNGFLTLEGGTSQTNVSHNNFFLLKINAGLPFRVQYSLFKNKITKKHFPRRDLRRFILEPVRRINRIPVKTHKGG